MNKLKYNLFIILKTVDNPLQDIYLVGLMRSVIYQFTEDELAEIRVVSPNDIYFINRFKIILRMIILKLI